jgi:hypothetical protein
MRLSWLCSLLDDGSQTLVGDAARTFDRSDFREEKMAGIAPTRKKIEETRHREPARFLAYILGFINASREHPWHSKQS